MSTPDPSASRFHTSVTRRVLGALAALALAGTLSAGPALAAAAAAPRDVSVRTSTTTVADLLAVLDDDEERALRDGIPNVPGTGLRFGDLTASQRAAAYALLRSLLSAAAWSELEVLREADAALGVEDDYRLALFGDPDADYMLQFSTNDVLLSILDQDGSVEVSPDVA